MSRIEINLPDDVMNNLKKLAAAEFRDPRSQAAIIIINELKQNELQATQQDQDEVDRLNNSFRYTQNDSSKRQHRDDQ
jgi:metal-responsive CopG/Arc/MetJ family transcriptional regulator